MSTALVQQIIVEAKGNTAHVEAAIKELRGELKGLKSEAAGAATAGGTIGNRYGSAAIGISSAAENMARLGKVTGESAKMMLNQSAQVAFAFGPTGMIVGAVAITTLAIAEMFGRAKKEAKDAADEAEKAFLDLAHSGSLANVTSQMRMLYGGDPDAKPEQRAKDPKLLGISELRRRRQNLTGFLADKGAPAFTKEMAAALDELEKKYAELVPLAEKFTKITVEQNDNGIRFAADKERQAKAEADAAEARRVTQAAAGAQIDDMTQAWKRGMDEQGDAIKARDAKMKESADTTARLADALANEMAKSTKTLVDDIQLKYNAWIFDAIMNGDKDLARQFIDARDAAMELQQSIEDLDEQAKLLGLDFKDIGDATKGGIDPKKFTQFADSIERAARGGIQLAEAMGMVDANTSKSLQAIAQIAVSLPQMKAAASSGQWGGSTGIIASALPIVGGIASVVDAFMSAGKAAREHAKALAEARAKLLESLQDRIGGYGLTDQQGRERAIAAQQKSDITAMLDLLIQQKGVHVGTREDFLAKDAAGQRDVLTAALASAGSPGVREALRAAIVQFDLIAEAAKKAAVELEKENEAKRASFDQSLEQRRLRLQGDTEAADALALLAQQEQELAAARKEGIYTAAQLAALEQVQLDERKKAADDAKKRREDEDKAKAQSAARQKEDLQTRINTADGETPDERARRREIEKRRELEDAMAASADLATLNLIKLAQAAEDAAAAATAFTQAQRDLEDLDVRILRAQGKTTEADNQAFENALKREWEDAIATGKSPAYLDKLAKAQAAERERRKLELAGGAGAGAMDGADQAARAEAAGATSASASVTTATVAQADRLVAEVSTIRLLVAQILDLNRMGLSAPDTRAVLGGGTVVRNTISVTFSGPVFGTRAEMAAIGRDLGLEVNRVLGQSYLNTKRIRGDVTI